MFMPSCLHVHVHILIHVHAYAGAHADAHVHVRLWFVHVGVDAFSGSFCVCCVTCDMLHVLCS